MTAPRSRQIDPPPCRRLGRAGDDAGFVAIAFALGLGLVLAGLLYLFNRAVYLRAQQELQQAADSLALAAASALRENGRSGNELEGALDALVEGVARPQLKLARIEDVNFFVRDVEDDALHESVEVEIAGKLGIALSFIGFDYASPEITVRSAAHVMRWLMTEERFPIVIAVADASDTMGQGAPETGKRSQWESLRQALLEYEERRFPSRFGLVVFRDQRTVAKRLTGEEAGGDVGEELLELIKATGIPLLRGEDKSNENEEPYASEQADQYRGYLQQDDYDPLQDDVRVLWTVPPELDSWEEIRRTLQEGTIQVAWGSTNLGNALAHARYMLEGSDTDDVDRTIVLVSNGEPKIPWDPAKQERCHKDHLTSREACEVPDAELVRQAFIDRASDLRQTGPLGASLVAIKLRSRTWAELVCEVFNKICRFARALVEKLDNEQGKNLAKQGVNLICGEEDAQGQAAAEGSGELAGATGASGDPGDPTDASECQDDEGWRGTMLRAITGGLRMAASALNELKLFNELMGPVDAASRFLQTRIWGTGKEESDLEWLKPLAGGPLDAVGNDPRYYTQVDAPETFDSILAAITHWTCVFDPLARFRSDEEEDRGRLEPDGRRAWLPVAFIRDGGGTDERLRRLDADDEMVSEDTLTHPWNREGGEREDEGYRLVDERQLGIRLGQKSCEKLGQRGNALVIRWGPPRLGLAPGTEPREVQR